MLRFAVVLIALLLPIADMPPSFAQAGSTAAAPSEPKPSRMKLTAEKIREMKARWIANKPKMKACRHEAKVKGLAGDDRWFFMSDCMEKS